MEFTLSKNGRNPFKKWCSRRVLAVFRRVSQYLMWAIFLGVATWLGYLWYMAVYQYEWTEAEKTQYRSEYAGETSFREEKFDQTVRALRERTRLHQAAPTVTKDIFKGTTF